jgi:hypothetical protein
VSFWLRGIYATQAVPSDPGLSIDMTYYSADENAARQTQAYQIMTI